jgi:hypothetical protein
MEGAARMDCAEEDEAGGRNARGVSARDREDFPGSLSIAEVYVPGR